MGVFKNDVGRPSNKTIILRRILKVVGLLVIIISAGFIGYSLKDNDKVKTNDKVLKEENTNKEDETKKIDILKAEEIMYGIFNEKMFFYYFDKETFNSDTFKTVYAIVNTKPKKALYTCSELFNDKLESNNKQNGIWLVNVSDNLKLQCEDNIEKDYYSYSDVEKVFNSMFSKGKMIKDYVSIGLVTNYGYSNSKDLYTFLSCECGDGGYDVVYGITEAKQNQNNIYLDFKYAKFESLDENTYIGYDDSSNEVTMSAKDVLDNNINKLPGKYKTYTFVFEKTDDNYKFVEVK